MEIWKQIEGYEGRYEVSNTGKVKNVETGLPKNPSKKTNGYLCLRLYKDGKGKNEYVHRLVLQAFEEINIQRQVNHINGDKADNVLSNLEWCTSSENHKHAYKIGLQKAKDGLNRGETNGRAKLKERDILEIRKLEGKLTLEKIGKIFGVSGFQIWSILKRKSWDYV
jgi:hypothetical protein